MWSAPRVDRPRNLPAERASLLRLAGRPMARPSLSSRPKTPHERPARLLRKRPRPARSKTLFSNNASLPLTWSPDGQKIAFVAGLMSDEPSVGGDLYTIAATGGEATNVTPEMKATANWLAWTPEGKIVFGETVDGDSGVAMVDPANGRNDSLW